MNSDCRHKIFTLLFAIFGFMAVMAAPSRRNTITITQPDGTTLEIRLVGNEYSHFTETSDGIMIVKDSAAVWRYAMPSPSGIITHSNIIAHNKEDRDPEEKEFIKSIDQNLLRASVNHSSVINNSAGIKTRATSIHEQGRYSTSTFPTKGNVKGLVFLVDFPDRSFSLEDDEIRDKFNRMLNQTGYKDTIKMDGKLIPGAYGSVKDYFEAQSFGQFSPAFDIVGPITADNSYAYYGQNDLNGYDETYAVEMVKEVILKAYNNGLVDFSQYDNDNDMEIDFIYVIYAGKGENYTGSDPYTIWPHQWVVETQVGNYWASRYACSPEIYVDKDELIDGIGTFCHEFSHIMGLPDFYPTNSGSGNSMSTIREWSVMDYGCYDNYGYSPVGYTALERYSLGWMDLTEISSPGDYVLPSIDSAQTAYLLPSDKKQSYILLETHNKEGWYQYQPAEGLLVTSVDYNREAWTSNTVNNISSAQRYKVIAADNDYSSNTRNGDMFPYKGNDSLTLYSTPASITGCGIPIDIPVMNIRYNDGVSTFSIADRVSSSIESNHAESHNTFSYTITDHTINLHSDIETTFTVYTITGKIVDSATVQPGSSVNIALPQKGIYLLRCNNKVLKITN